LKKKHKKTKREASGGGGPAGAPALPGAAPAVEAVNIGAKERRLRIGMGAMTLIIGVVIAAVLIFTGVNRLWRLFLVIPFYNAALGFLQARSGTCVMMAGQGYKKMDKIVERVIDPEHDRQLRRQARNIYIMSAVTAAAAAALSLLIPQM